MYRGRERISSPVKTWLNPSLTSETPSTVLAYERPSDWLTLPTVSSGDEKVIGLHAVYDTGSNFCSFYCYGDYTVDWGDGSSSENISGGDTAYHNFDYDDLNISTLTTRGYKQAIITITPQEGSNLTYISFGVRHEATLVTYASQWLDIIVAAENCTYCKFGDAIKLYNKMLEKFTYVGSNSITDFQYMFRYCQALQSVNIEDISGVTTFSNTFTDCFSLKSITLTGSSSALSFKEAFYQCYALQEANISDMSNVTDCTGLFFRCYSLQNIILPDTPNLTTLSNMFYECFSLQTATLTDMTSASSCVNMFYFCKSLREVTLPSSMSSVSSCQQMFHSCFSLKEVTLGDLSNTSTADDMFRYCSSLLYVSISDLSSATDSSDMFYQCYALREVSLLDTTAMTNATNMFFRCKSLQKLTMPITPSLDNCTNMFYECGTLQVIPLLDVSSVTIFSNMFFRCYSLQKGALSGTSDTISYADTRMDREELVEVFNNLETVVGKTITVTGNWGVADLSNDDKAIATDKGWTLTL